MVDKNKETQRGCLYDKVVGDILVLCKECTEKQYPKKGKFTIEEIKRSGHVKAGFGNEHMWVKVYKVSDVGVQGRLDNTPILPTNLRLGSSVFITLGEVEDIASVFFKDGSYIGVPRA